MLRSILVSFLRPLSRASLAWRFRGRGEISPSTIAHACTLVPTFSPSFFLLGIGKQSARCLLSSHSTCLLAHEPLVLFDRISLVAYNSRNNHSRQVCSINLHTASVCSTCLTLKVCIKVYKRDRLISNAIRLIVNEEFVINVDPT